MPITDQYERLPLDAIYVRRDERQRREIDTSDLDESIRQRGVLSPIIVQRVEEFDDLPPRFVATLVAGERRLEASKKLELPDIPVRWIEQLSPVEAQIIELEENIKRQQLTWQDQTRAVARIHHLYCELDAGWTLAETGQAIGLTISTISLYLSVAREMHQERIAEAQTVREAYNIIARRSAREMGDALEELLDVPPPTIRLTEHVAGVPLSTEQLITMTEQEVAEWNKAKSNIVVLPSAVPVIQEAVQHISFLDWAPAYSGPKFNFIHCDFPYGRNEFSGLQARGAEPTALYDSSSQTYFDLLECLCVNLDRYCSLSAHLMFWCASEILDIRSEYTKRTYQMFAKLAPSWQFSHFPLIWLKTDNSGIAADPRHGPRHIYEVCLLASRAQRQIVRIAADAYGSPGDRSLHPSTKPVPMLKHFMQMLVDDTTRMLDPTCGSGAALRAADALGAQAVLGLELDANYVRIANQAYRNDKLLRVASKHASAK